MEDALQKITRPTEQSFGRACPICSARGAHLWDKESFRIARCTKCLTLFVENPPHDTAFIYDQGYFFGGEQGGGYGSYDEEKESMRATFERCLDMIGKYTQGSLFDIGAATGYFLSLARKRGFEVSGIDISAAAVAVAKEKGIEVKVGTLRTVSYPPDSFEVVTMFDVLEHVADPHALLAQASTILKPGGILFGSTPDSGSVNARLMGKRWHMLFPPEHLVLMNDTSLRLILNQEGYEVLWTGRVTKRFSLPYILQTASRWLKIPLLARLGSSLRGSWLSRIAIPLDLRDNLFFLAKKRA